MHVILRTYLYWLHLFAIVQIKWEDGFPVCVNTRYNLFIFHLHLRCYKAALFPFGIDKNTTSFFIKEFIFNLKSNRRLYFHFLIFGTSSLFKSSTNDFWKWFKVNRWIPSISILPCRWAPLRSFILRFPSFSTFVLFWRCNNILTFWVVFS